MIFISKYLFAYFQGINSDIISQNFKFFKLFRQIKYKNYKAVTKGYKPMTKMGVNITKR